MALRLPLVLLFLASACAAPVPPPRAAPAPPAGERGAFVVRMGTDTVAVESYVRTADRLTGELVIREPDTRTRSYTAELRPDGTVRRFHVRLHSLGMSPVPTPYTFTYDFSGDTARVAYERDGEREEQRVAGAGVGAAMLALRYSHALQEQALLLARKQGRPEALTTLPVSARAAAEVRVRPLGGDSILLETADGPAVAWMDERGRITRFSGMRTTVKVVSERIPGADVAALAAAFARRDHEGRGLGQLSPRDSVSARIGGAIVSVAYGRPARRGRQVMGTLIPWNEPWRAGANIMTHLSSDRGLVVGGAAIPAGRYSLFTLATPAGWTLIVNRATGRSGVEYDAARDLVRIPMNRALPMERPERFTIRLEPRAASAGTLRMTWDDVEVSVPIQTQ